MHVSRLNVRRPLEPGARVGDHLMVRSVLGKGGTAVVFEALHTRLNSLVALKVAMVDAAYAEDARARLEREAIVCAAIEDEHIPKIFDVGALPDGTPYIVMEKVSGPTLESLLQGAALTPRQALEIARDLLCALECVHRAGIVHRDVKPSNLIVQTSAEGALRVRLMDFGVSRTISRNTADPAITRQGALVGTPHYMAPEQVCDEGVDGRTDVYAVGVLLYEMFAGRVPFVGASTAEVLAAVLRNDYVPLDRAGRHAPQGLSALVARAMAERPAQRFACARDMRDAIDTLMAGLDQPQAVVARGSLYARGGSHLTVFGGAAAAIALLGALAAFPDAASRTHAPRRRQAPASAVSVAAPRAETPAAYESSALKPRPIANASLLATPAPPVARSPKARPLPRTRTPLVRVERATHSQARATTRPPLSGAAGLVLSDYLRKLNELMGPTAAQAEAIAPPQPTAPEALPENPYPS